MARNGTSIRIVKYNLLTKFVRDERGYRAMPAKRAGADIAVWAGPLYGDCPVVDALQWCGSTLAVELGHALTATARSRLLMVAGQAFQAAARSVSNVSRSDWRCVVGSSSTVWRNRRARAAYATAGCHKAVSFRHISLIHPSLVIKFACRHEGSAGRSLPDIKTRPPIA
jgi:hypothetical protein